MSQQRFRAAQGGRIDRSRPLGFRFDYRPLGPKGKHADTRQVIDTWSSRAVHTLSDGKTRFGWDGQRAWVHPAGADTGLSPRFWALLAQLCPQWQQLRARLRVEGATLPVFVDSASNPMPQEN